VQHAIELNSGIVVVNHTIELIHWCPRNIVSLGPSPSGKEKENRSVYRNCLILRSFRQPKTINATGNRRITVLVHWVERVLAAFHIRTVPSLCVRHVVQLRDGSAEVKRSHDVHNENRRLWLIQPPRNELLME